MFGAFHEIVKNCCVIVYYYPEVAAHCTSRNVVFFDILLMKVDQHPLSSNMNLPFSRLEIKQNGIK